MSRFIDVLPFNWFFDDVVEASELKLEGRRFISGIPYNVFVTGKYAYEDTIEVNEPTSEFIIDRVITISNVSPLICFVDDLMVGLDNVEILDPSDNYPNGSTLVKLSRLVPRGSKVDFLYTGEPAYISEDPYERNRPVGVGGTTVEYPSAELLIQDNEPGFNYVYEPYSNIGTEVVKYNGSQLRRVDSLTKLSDEGLYYIDPNSETIYTHYSLNNKTIELSVLIYKAGIYKTFYHILRPKSPSIIYNNRFFPDTYMSRAEFISLLNRLRLHFYVKYTDSEPFRSTKDTSRFSDVQATLDASGDNKPWWWEDVRDFEELYTLDKDSEGNNTPILSGYYDSTLDVYNLKLEYTVTKAEVAVLINKMRKWFIDVFV